MTYPLTVSIGLRSKPSQNLQTYCSEEKPAILVTHYFRSFLLFLCLSYKTQSREQRANIQSWLTLISTSDTSIFCTMA